MNASITQMALSEIWAMRFESLQSALAAGPVSGKRTNRLPRVEGSIAVIPLHGMITQRGSVWDDLFGGTSTMRFEAAFSRAMNNPQIGGIVLDVDSPGGTTPGVKLASDRVYAARGQKPVVAVANSMADSAAYWIASAAEYFVAVPGAWSIGSIGVYRMHEDYSEAMAKDGVKVTLIGVPEYKTEGNPYEPLTAEGAAFSMQQVEATYAEFVKDVARNRGVSSGDVKAHFGKGRDFHADQAKEMNMIDRIVAMDQVFREMAAKNGTGATQEANLAMTAELCEAWASCEITPRSTGETIQRRKKLLSMLTKESQS